MNTLAAFAYLFKDMLTRVSDSTSYGSELESYIMSHNPQDASDVERLTHQYNQLLNARKFGSQMY